VIGGSERGRRLQVPKGRDVRPTPDRVRETLFNWLQGEIAGAVVLDLFAGSGALGVEALSRGAAFATFVETGRAARGALASNLEAFRSPPHESPPRGGENGSPLGGRGLSGENGPPGEGGGRFGSGSGGGRFELVRASAWGFLEKGPGRRYDLVFLDPPYGRGWAARAAGLLAAGGWLAPQAAVYVETGVDEGAPAVPAGWRLRREGTCGDVAYRLYQCDGEETA
jgi:16S rRNA (guanine966-N2)-methyltransferase